MMLASIADIATTSPTPDAAASTPMIAMHGDRISVDAHDVPWSVLLPELERRTGIKIQVKRPLGGALTAEFEHLPLEEGLQRVFRDANIVFLYGKGGPDDARTDKLTEIWLMPKKGSVADGNQLSALSWEETEAAPARDLKGDSQTSVEGPNPEERLEALETFARQGNVEALRQALLDPDQSTQIRVFELLAEQYGPGAMATLLDLARDEEAGTRLQALSLLSRVGQAESKTVVSALGESLADTDGGVKSYAIAALASWGIPDALDYLRQALRDPDPFTRTLVIESLALQEQGLPLLYEAMADTDTEVRSTAGFWLEKQGAWRRNGR